MHSLSHVPQWLGSAFVLVHEPEQFVVPASHVEAQLPIEQASPVSQALLHSPQCNTLDSRLTQALPQTARPVLHTKPHEPLLQVADPPAGGTQALPQLPQCCVSLTLTQLPLHA
jgi:hypothetical protein